jgi:HK97 family phage portal protein
VNLVARFATALRKAAQLLSPVNWYGSGGWFTVSESYSGAWQQGVTVNQTTVSANWAVFACVTLIAGDIAKMPARVMKYSRELLIWQPTDPPYRIVLRRPNRYQTRIEFFQNWVLSLLLFGNTYVLKERDRDGKIVALYILDPGRVQPLVAADGGVYYQLQEDDLAQIESSIVVPASEIIHDRMYTPWHPLIGVSPIYACGVAAMQGSYIQSNSAAFFKNMSRPGGVLTAPGTIPPDTAARLKEQWQTNYTGENAGKVAVLGDGLKYESSAVNAVDAQLIEQLKFTGEMICACFHVPPYKLGLGAMPTVNNTAALNQQYYDQALQPIVEKIELRLDEGLELLDGFETWLDETVLVRMDPSTRMDAYNKAIAGGWLAPNEARRDENRPPVPGGESPLMQQQNYSLAALAKRDASDDPFGKAAPAPAPEPEPVDEEPIETDLKQLSVQVADAVGERVAGALQPLQERLAAIEARPEPPEVRGLTLEDVQPLIEAEVQRRLPAPADTVDVREFFDAFLRGLEPTGA